MTRYLSLLALLTLSATPLYAETEPVEVTLLAAKEGGEEGELLVGVDFKMQPGWHIYWRYPGEIGKPTQVRLALPEGYQEQPFLWPLPHIFKIPSSPDGYGYEGKALLISEVKSPVTKGPSTGSSEIKVGAVVKYLACSAKACLPGTKELSTHAVIGETPTLNTLREEKKRVLSQKTSPGASLHVEVKGSAAEQATVPVKASLTWDGQPQSVEWFPVPPSQAKIKNVHVSPETLSFQVDLKEHAGEVVEIPSVFAIVSTDGKRSAVEHVLKIPVSR